MEQRGGGMQPNQPITEGRQRLVPADNHPRLRPIGDLGKGHRQAKQKPLFTAQIAGINPQHWQRQQQQINQAVHQMRRAGLPFSRFRVDGRAGVAPAQE
ncbi:hypothetical protein D3C78_1459810 [compost metagenome]